MTAEQHRAGAPRVVVVGAGLSGVAAAARLLAHGVRDLVVLERADDVGGTWRDNRYPGCVCDVPSLLYSLDEAPNPGWTRRFAPQPEIWSYVRDVAERTGVRARTRFGTALVSATWDDDAALWSLDTSTGPLQARVLVVATGALSEPAVPDVPGLADFAGPVMHSARWRDDVDLTGLRVAVVGTGASAVQIVPAIADRVAELHLLQRAPAWVLPRHDRPVPGALRRMYARWPATARVVRTSQRWSREVALLGFRYDAVGRAVEAVSRRHLARAVRDPVLREALTPTYRIGCKRILLSDDYWPALARPHVHLIPSALRHVTGRHVVAVDGTEVEVDALVLATGFRVTEPPVAGLLTGRYGRTLADTWRGSPQAYAGTTVSGFPNLFLLLGPGTGLGHTSVLLQAEAQVEHLLGALGVMASAHLTTVEPRPAAQRAYVADLDRALARTVWERGGCDSYYRDRTGRLSALWPRSTWAFGRRVSRFDPADYALRPARASSPRISEATPVGSTS